MKAYLIFPMGTSYKTALEDSSFGKVHISITEASLEVGGCTIRRCRNSTPIAARILDYYLLKKFSRVSDIELTRQRSLIYEMNLKIEPLLTSKKNRVRQRNRKK